MGAENGVEVGETYHEDGAHDLDPDHSRVEEVDEDGAEQFRNAVPRVRA